MQRRLEAAALFIGRLYELSGSPHSLRQAASVGADVGINGEFLEQALVDAAAAGPIDRRADDPDLVMLTDKGRMAAGA